MEKVCIFCRKFKDEGEFNDEHIFPATIGGKYVISSVCSNCNKTLGKNIDNPFSSFKPILKLRRKYKLAREAKEGGQRNIGNPYSGKFPGADGHEYYCTIDNDGNPIRNMVPKYEIFQTEDDRPIGKLSLSAKDFTSEEDVIKMFAKRANRDPREIRLGKIEKNTTPPLEVIIDMASDPLIIEALKIAYEFAMTSVPYYGEDSNSKFIGELLILDKIEVDPTNWFEQNEEVLAELSKKIYFTRHLQPYEHIAFLTSISGKGLYSVLKIFDFPPIILKLSDKHYKLPRLMVLFDDSISSLS